jgi:hypothetical protein
MSKIVTGRRGCILDLGPTRQAGVILIACITRDLSVPEDGSADRARPGAVCALQSSGNQSAFAFSSIAACSFLISSGDNCGRFILTVNLLSLAVNGNGGL